MAEVCVAIAVVIGLLFLYASLTARRLDRLHSLVAKSRRALEQALTARAQYARDFAASGGLDIASAIVLAESAESCLHEGMRPIVPDGFYTIDGFSEEPADAAHLPDRRDLESSLSRTLRLTVDDLHEEEVGDAIRPLAAELERARLNVRMTRSFHNSHVAQVHQVRRAPLVSFLHLYGRAPLPSTVDMDDE